MLKKYFVFPLLATLASLLVVFLWTGAREPSPTPPEPEAPRTLTWLDTLLVKYDSILTVKADSTGLVGGAVVITHDGRVVYRRCFGVKEAGSSDSVGIHTLFRLASVSKTMTGVLAGILADSGLIGLDDKVISFLPDLRLKDTLHTNNVTVRHVLSHTTGLAPHAYDNLVEEHVPMRVLIDSLFRVNIAAPPGTFYAYQNVVFSLYDTIAALRTGKNFPSLLQDYLFDPFGMKDASAGLAPFVNNPDRAMPHARRNGGYSPLPINDRYYNTLPAAGINASIDDMGHFLIALTGGDSSLISSRTLDEVFAPQVRTILKWTYLRRWDKVEAKQYAIGWRLIGYRERQVAYHGGYVKGYQSEIAVCRHDSIGIAWLSNSPGAVGPEVVPLFLDMYFDEVKK